MIYNTEELKALYQDYQKSPKKGYECGISSLDSIIRLDKKSLVIVTAKPSDGKTTWLNYYSYLMARKHGWKTLFYEFEGSQGRMVSDMLRYYGANFSEFADKCKVADTTKVTSLETIYGDIKAAKETNNIDMVIVDTFTNLYPYLGKDVNTSTIGNVLTEFSKVAKELDLCMIITAHPTKMQEGQEISAYNICGSNNFYNLADFIYSLKANRDRHTTTFKVLKVRDNVDKGICGKSTTLRFDPQDKTYKMTTPEEQDEEFASPKERAEREAFLEVADKSKKDEVQEAMDIALGNETEQVNQEIFNANVSLFESVSGKKVMDLPLKDALEYGKEHCKNMIDDARKMKARNKDEEYKKLKRAIPAFTLTLQGDGHGKGDIRVYNNLICIDVDAQDNEGLEVMDIKKRLKKSPYVFYCARSLSNKGCFALVQVDGDESDYKAHFEPLKRHFEGLGLVIDKQCSDTNRLRVVSYDTPYTNMKAQVFKEKSHIASNIQHHPSSTTKQRPSSIKNDGIGFNLAYMRNKIETEEELQSLDMAVCQMEKEGGEVYKKIIPEHQDTLKLAMYLKARLDGYKDGNKANEFFHRIKKLKPFYDELEDEKTFLSADIKYLNHETIKRFDDFFQEYLLTRIDNMTQYRQYNENL